MTGDTVPVRVCALLVAPDGRVCVIRRHRPGGLQHSLPGGLLADGEQPTDALRRELREELGLDLAAAGAEDVDLVLRFEQYQESRRPVRAGLFRRRHLVHVVHLPRPLADDVALVELDAEDATEVLWLAPADLAGAHLYPDVGEHLVDAVTQAPPGGAGPVLLPAMTDASYQWR
ncbi:NUDIX domain-containing protein [Kitasatospora cineracea]|uniref:NUDIX domain-containing protein n=1 Tax=Kitasatospora cineracea TaxID=88074 RepID=UPI0036C2FD66